MRVMMRSDTGQNLEKRRTSVESARQGLVEFIVRSATCVSASATATAEIVFGTFIINNKSKYYTSFTLV